MAPLEWTSLPEMFFARARRRGDAPLLSKRAGGEVTRLTWKETRAAVERTAAALVRAGLAPGDRAAVLADNGPDLAVLDLALLAAGGTAVPLYTTAPAEQIRYVVEHSESRFLFFDRGGDLPRIRGALHGLPCRPIRMGGGKGGTEEALPSAADAAAAGAPPAGEGAEVERRTAALAPEDLSVIIYTSGTTGPPKGAMISHRNVLWTTASVIVPFDLSEEDEVISFLPLAHIAERMLSIYIPMRVGYRVNFVESTDTITDNMVEISPTFMLSVPRIWEKYNAAILIKMKDATLAKRLAFGAAMAIGRRYAAARLDAGRKVPLWLKGLFHLAHFAVMRPLKKRLGFERLKMPVSAAAPISPDVLRFYHALGLPLRQLYGQTEGTGPTTCHRGDIIDPENTGPPIPGVQVRIAEDGEILVKGPNVFLGYYKNPEATAETIVDGWLHSGDVGELDQRGFLKITDRKKDLIITSGGKNIAPQYIENKLKFSPYINDAVVIGDGRKYITALIFIDEDNVVKFAQENKVQFDTFASLTRAPEVIKLIAREVDKVNQTLARVEQIKRFRLLPKKLIAEDGEVTPTMKLKRKYINEAYADLIEEMYRGSK